MMTDTGMFITNDRGEFVKVGECTGFWFKNDLRVPFDGVDWDFIRALERRGWRI